MTTFISGSFDSVKVELTPSRELPVEDLKRLAREHLETAWRKNRRARKMIESCTAILTSDSEELKLRANAGIVTAHHSSDFVYTHPMATCVNCGWQDNDKRSSPDSPFYCSSLDCQAKQMELAKEAFIEELEVYHAEGQCGFHPYYQPTCVRLSVSATEPFCGLHQGMKCSNCDRQAVGEQGWSGSLNYFYPFCEDHWFTKKRW